MDPKVCESLERLLRNRRDALWREVASEEERLSAIAEDRESEWEERAQEENAARILDRLDERGKREIEAIDAALRRMREGSYGKCSSCGGSSSITPSTTPRRWRSTSFSERFRSSCSSA